MFAVSHLLLQTFNRNAHSAGLSILWTAWWVVYNQMNFWTRSISDLTFKYVDLNHVAKVAKFSVTLR